MRAGIARKRASRFASDTETRANWDFVRRCRGSSVTKHRSRGREFVARWRASYTIAGYTGDRRWRMRIAEVEFLSRGAATGPARVLRLAGDRPDHDPFLSLSFVYTSLSLSLSFFFIVQRVPCHRWRRFSAGLASSLAPFLSCSISRH